ncbi:hypothetical protein C7405_107143 [Paraburkholderia caballeronis]|uniref:hypothetical protein n=1 Tax=Paraburkholderia caballeronis TaxID=416943 RepID=UPI001066C012|nr:hypothetical protein [Paraburkholderia caballeronis]TDV34744.1 hypothetical protein C7405_107143 [Paraburkholderia caballeronis]
MTVRLTSAPSLEALPNPRGGHVPAARSALAEAARALEQHGDVATPLQHAVHALHDAGWLAAARFADTLLIASPLAVAGAAPSQAGAPARASAGAHAADAATAPDRDHAGDARTRFVAALHDLSAALDRHSLSEIACSPTLFAHQQALCEVLAPHAPGFALAFEDVALAGRPVPPAQLRPQPGQRLAQLRARFEAALLPALRAQDNGSRAAAAWADAAFGEMDACLTDLAGPDPYDFWRLAAACGRALRRGAQTSGETEARRFYARCNLALADHARGLRVAPQSLVRSTLALLWRDYALFGASADDTADVELLRDYGLTVEWHVAGSQASDALWEAGSMEADQVASRVAPTRELGALAVNANAYEDFLQTADASMAALNETPGEAGTPERASAALLKADAAYRLGANAWALGLGHVALLADALGLAWRRVAHAAAGAASSASASAAAPAFVEPDAASLEHAGEALRATLLKVAAGVAQPDVTAAVDALGRAIGHSAGHPAGHAGAR